MGLLSMDDGLLWGMVACCLGLLGFPGKPTKDLPLPVMRAYCSLLVCAFDSFAVHDAWMLARLSKSAK